MTLLSSIYNPQALNLKRGKVAINGKQFDLLFGQRARSGRNLKLLSRAKSAHA